VLFGEYRLIGKLELSTPRGMLILEKVGNNAVRIVKRIGELESSKLVSLIAISHVALKAIPPLGGPWNSNCVYVVLPEPVALSHEAVLQSELKLPVDLGVFIGEELVDVIPLGRVKYALYGSPDLGDICRYVDTKILESYVMNVAKSRVLFKSRGNARIEITKLVIPVKSATVYSTERGELYISDIEVNALSPTHVEVRVTAETSYTIPGKLLSVLKGPGATYIMKYGV